MVWSRFWEFSVKRRMVAYSGGSSIVFRRAFCACSVILLASGIIYILCVLLYGLIVISFISWLRISSILMLAFSCVIKRTSGWFPESACRQDLHFPHASPYSVLFSQRSVFVRAEANSRLPEPVSPLIIYAWERLPFFMLSKRCFFIWSCPIMSLKLAIIFLISAHVLCA